MHACQILRAPGTVLPVLLLLGVSAFAQIPRAQSESGREDKTGKGSIRGRVTQPGGAFITESVKVTLVTVTGPQSTIFTDNQGSFEFPDLIPGNYEVQVETNGKELEVISQSVAVFRGAPSIITIPLRDKKSTKTPAKSISLGEIGAE